MRAQSIFDSLGGVLEGAPTGDSIVLRVDLNAYVGNDCDSCKGVTGSNGLLDLNPSGAVIGLLCLANIMSNYMGACKSTLHQELQS